MTQNATRIQIRVSARARRSAVVGPYGDGWKVQVAAPPESGKANVELVRFLGAVLGCDVRIVSGASSPSKVVEVEGLSSERARVALERACSDQ
jgi:uncharacterized protein (TIGR00251 family)